MSSNHISPNCMKCFIQFREQIKTSYCIKYSLYVIKSRMLSFNTMSYLFLTNISKEYFYSYIATSHCQVRELDWFCPSFQSRASYRCLVSLQFYWPWKRCTMQKQTSMTEGRKYGATKQRHYFFFFFFQDGPVGTTGNLVSKISVFHY